MCTDKDGEADAERIVEMRTNGVIRGDKIRNEYQCNVWYIGVTLIVDEIRANRLR